MDGEKTFLPGGPLGRRGQRTFSEFGDPAEWLKFFRREANFHLSAEAIAMIRVAFEKETKKKCPEETP